MKYKIVETDNFGRDYPDESFVNIPPLPKEQCEEIATVINKHCNLQGTASRYWKVVSENYALQPGFEP